MSTTITITRHLRSSADDLYGIVADPTGLGEITGARVDIFSSGSADGTGVVRRVRLPGGVMLRERIVSLDPDNRRFGYLIEDSRPHFEHEHGEISFVPEGSGCEVTWTSRVALPAGRLTPVAERIAHAIATTAFSGALVLIDAHLRRNTKRIR